MTKRRSRHGATTAVGLAQTALEALDLGVLVVRPLRGEVLYSNAAARALLALDGPGDARTLCLSTALLKALVPREATAERFTRAVEVPTPAGGRMFVRAKYLDSEQELLLLALSRRTLRREDLVDRLSRDFGFSRRECQVLLLVREGLRNDDIADQLGLSVTTVKWYLARMFPALGVRSRGEAVACLERLQARAEEDGS